MSADQGVVLLVIQREILQHLEVDSPEGQKC